jgi:hypothetical protein
MSTANIEIKRSVTEAKSEAGLAASGGSATVYTTHHMCVDIEGVLRWPDKDLRSLFTTEGTHEKSGKVVRDWLKLQLLQGKRVLPMGEKCEGWSDVDGCPGHPRKPDSESPNEKLTQDAGGERGT